APGRPSAIALRTESAIARAAFEQSPAPAGTAPVGRGSSTPLRRRSDQVDQQGRDRAEQHGREEPQEPAAIHRAREARVDQREREPADVVSRFHRGLAEATPPAARRSALEFWREPASCRVRPMQPKPERDRALRPASLLPAVLLAAACAAVPDETPRDVGLELPASFGADAGASGPLPDRWWRSFEDPALVAVVEAA